MNYLIEKFKTLLFRIIGYLKIEEIVKLINKIEIPNWSKVENEINDFNQFLLKLKI